MMIRMICGTTSKRSYKILISDVQYLEHLFNLRM